MNAQEQIEHIATSGNSVDRLAMLKAMKHDTVTQSTLADQVGIARKTAHRFLRELDECLIDEHPDGYRLTGAGATALHAFVTARNQLGRERLYSLAHSPSERVYLRLLSSQPMERAAIASVGDISRKTVDRLTSDFMDKRYVASTDAGTYDLSAAGDYVITAYDRLVQSFEQIFSNAVCLQCLDVGVETLPAHALADESTLLRTRPGQSVATRRKFLQFVQGIDTAAIDHLRVFTSFSNVELNNVFTEFVQAGTDLDLVAPASLVQAYTAMDADVLTDLRELVESEQTSYWLYQGSLPCSLVIFDHEVANIVPSSPPDMTPPYGDIRSFNPTVVDWAVDLFDEYVDDALRSDPILRIIQQTKADEYVHPLYGHPDDS